MGKHILTIGSDKKEIAQKNYDYFMLNYPDKQIKVLGFIAFKTVMSRDVGSSNDVYWAWAVGYDFERKDIDGHVAICRYKDVTDQFRR